jgi:hypothetical protein
MKRQNSSFRIALRRFLVGTDWKEIKDYCGPWVDGLSEKELYKRVKEFKRRVDKFPW